jgi:CRP/FNR family transcriptional regulator, cyclic AMP receptor protein
MTTVLPLLSSDDRDALTCLGRARRFPRGGWLMSQGEAGDTVVVVLRGRVKISTVTREGADVVCAVHGPGSVIGHFEAIDSDGLGRTASVIALEAVDCRVLDGEDFRIFLRQRPDAAMALLRAMVRDLRAADRRRADIAAGDITRHLARFLLEQLELRHQVGDTNGDLDFGLSQAELAGVVSASRAAVVRGLSALRKTGAVATSPRQIIVTDVAALRDAAL